MWGIERTLTSMAMLTVFLATCGCCCCSNLSTSSYGNDYSSGWATPSAGPYTPTSNPWAYTSPTPATTAPASLATGTYLRRSLYGGDGELEVSNGLDEDAIIKITRTSDPDHALDSVYVGAEDFFIIDGIPDGYYYVYYMTGTGWNSTAEKFDDPGVCKKFEDSFEYTTTADEYTTWQIEIKPVVGGNADTDYVSPKDFPA